MNRKIIGHFFVSLLFEVNDRVFSDTLGVYKIFQLLRSKSH